MIGKILRAGALAMLVLTGPAWAADPVDPRTTGTIRCASRTYGSLARFNVKDGYLMCTLHGSTYIVKNLDRCWNIDGKVVAIFSPAVECVWLADEALR